MSQSVNYLTLHTDATIDASVINGNLPTGSIMAQSSALNGSAGFTIPLAMPPGTNGVEPELTLTYNSAGGQSILGFGWGLSGISAIIRVGQTHYYDDATSPIEYNANDRFALDGNRMVLISGTYGATGSVYGYENENFSRITSFGGTTGDPSYFILETKEGIKYEYGKDNNSRHNTTSGKAMFWYLSKMIYPDGNYILYKYKTSHSWPNGDIWSQHTIDEIEYTGNDFAGISPFAKVKFNYLQRTDDIIQYQNGNSLPKGLAIGNIVITTENDIVKTYEFKYGYRKGNTFLHEIIEKGSDGVALNPTRFKYGNEPTGNQTNLLTRNIYENDNIIPANLNGDGITDNLFARRSILHPNEDTLFHGYSNVNFSINLTTSGKVIGVADFNGDNLDDVAELYFVTETFNGTNYASYRIKIHYNSDPNGVLDYNENFTLLPNSTNALIREHINNIDLNPMFIGDFNGDGLADIFYVRGDFRHIAYGNRDLNQPLLPWEIVTVNLSNPNTLNYNWGADIEKMAIVDYNGDSKSDILVINGAQGAVFEFENSTQLKEIFFQNDGALSVTYRLFDQEFLTFYGDFNSDGKTDILIKTGDQNSDPWFINYATGSGYFRVAFDFVRNPSIEQTDFDVYEGDIVSVGDYNGDNKSDIVLIGRVINVGTYSDAYFSRGYAFDDPINETHTNVGYVISKSGPSFTGIDGKSRCLYRLNTSYDALEVGIGLQSKENLLQKIRNGELHTTIFDYKLMSEKIDINDDFYTRGSLTGVSNTISNVQLPVWLVQSYKVQDGQYIGEPLTDTYMKVQSFKYANSKLHREGKGLLGFGVIIAEDKWSYLRSISYASPNETFGFMLPDSVLTEFITGTDFTKSISHYSISTINNIRYLTKPTVMTINNYYENRKTITEYLTYDNYANPTLMQIARYSGNNNNIIDTKVIYSTYGAFGSTFADKITSTNTVLMRTGEPTYNSINNFDYNTKGQLKTKIEFFGQPKAVKSDYLYHNHGGIFKSVQSSVGLDSLIEYYFFDPKGRYINEKRNYYNDIIYSASFDAKWGKETSVTNENGLTSTFTYDNFGRAKTSTTPTNITTTTNYNWDILNGVKNEVVTSPSRPTIKNYFDQMGRKRKTEIFGFNGELITETMNYDKIGNPYQSTSPRKSSESQLTTTRTYGAAFTAQRLEHTSTNVSAFGNVQYNYSYNQGNEIITTTLPDGKTQVKIIDAAGKILQSTDNNGNILNYSYYSHGGLREVSNGSNILVSIEYDEYKRKKKQTDVSSGITMYEFDAFGRLVSETNAKGQQTFTVYDKLQRLKNITRPEGITTYDYYAAGILGKAFKLKKISGHSGDLEELEYDNNGRIISQKITIDGISYETNTSYDGLDRVYSRSFPSGNTLNYDYDTYSYLKRIYNNTTNYVTIDEVNGRGQITKYTLGNGKQSIHEYFHGIPTRYKTSDLTFDYKMVWDYKSGNLKSRQDQYGNKDTITYDNLDRIYTWTRSNLLPTIRKDTMTYASNGNIIKKTDVGVYTYDPVRVHALSEVTNPAGVIRDPEQDIVYNSFLQPVTITEANYMLEYTYGHHGNRIKSVIRKNGVIIQTKYYLGEYEKVIDSSGTYFVSYISAEGQLVAIVHSVGNSHSPHYTYTDHLGSIVMVTNATGTIDAQQNFDPWGRRRHPSTWEYIDENLPLNLPKWLYRGYTGHEHLPQFNLINMNGRLYDPEVGRMLSPDNYIQDGGYSQNYNRYSYALNNPLKYTDPDGNIIVALLFTVASNVIFNGLDNVANDKPFFNGAGKAATIGIVSGVFTFGIGEIAGQIGNVYLRAGFQIAAHGSFNGVLSEMQGGRFVDGFKSGAVSSLASSVSTALKLGPATTIVVGSVSGGLTAELSGGSFWEGFRNGLVIAALNHAEHEVIKQPEVATIYFTTDGVGHTFLEIGGTVYTYGRYGARSPESSGDFAPLGEGILHKYTGKAAKNYIKSVTSKSEYFSYKVSIKSKQSVHEYYNSLIKNGQSVNKYTYNVDNYFLFSNNCTTHSLNALRAGGAELPYLISPSGVYQYFYPPKNYEIIYSKWGPKY